METDENRQKPEQIKQSIIDGDSDIGCDVNIDSVNTIRNTRTREAKATQ